MTEDEAKTRWCPFTRLVTTEQGSSGMVTGAPSGHNRFSGSPAEVCLAALCMGSACMAWRSQRIPMSEDHGWDDDGKPKQIAIGFCGLAGAPA